MAAEPWFSAWNYDLFRMLFRYVPHSDVTDEYCKVLLATPLLSTWVFAFCFYRYWTKNDELTAWRRRCLVTAIVAFAIAGLVTLILRPWIYWPAPVLSPRFQPLFPRLFWGNGSENCFPSHSTLAYFTIGAGFWPMNRRLSVLLSITALLCVSFPRVYVGGHYPIDVLFSCILAVLVLAVLWHWPVLSNRLSWPPAGNSPGTLEDLIFFLWIFELGEGFHSTELLASVARRVFFGG
jgi:membrane-associated phospholipid phosphatase